MLYKAYIIYERIKRQKRRIKAESVRRKSVIRRTIIRQKHNELLSFLLLIHNIHYIFMFCILLVIIIMYKHTVHGHMSTCVYTNTCICVRAPVLFYKNSEKSILLEN